jgi:hypothetical protein
MVANNQQSRYRMMRKRIPQGESESMVQMINITQKAVVAVSRLSWAVSGEPSSLVLTFLSLCDPAPFVQAIRTGLALLSGLVGRYQACKMI